MSAPHRWARLSVRDVIGEPGDPPSSTRLTPYLNHATPPLTAAPGHVVLSLLTGEGVPVLASLPASHHLLPHVLARKGTRVRDVAPNVTLPEPDEVAPAPRPSSYSIGNVPYRFRRIRLLPNHPAYPQETHK
jgi:hypothetical protein